MDCKVESELVLITGGAGFIGSNLARRLVREGHRVRILDNLSPQIHGNTPKSSSPLYQSVAEIAEIQVGSINSRDHVARALVDVDRVVHLAAETGTGQSMYEIERYVDTNVNGTGILLDLLATSEHSVRKLVVASSRAIYGEGKYTSKSGEPVYPLHRSEDSMNVGDFEVHSTEVEGRLSFAPTDEGSKLHPSSVYGITKLTQEQLVMTVCPTLNIAPVALRYQNVYGPGQSLSNPYTGILSIFSNLIRKGEPINVFEDGLESRDFVYIDDVVEATYRALLMDRADGKAFNVGSGVAISVAEVVETLMDVFGRRVPVTVTGNYRLGDIRHNLADLRFVREQLGYEPSVPFVDGVRLFAEWVQSQPVIDGKYEASLAEMRRKNLFK